MNIGALYFDFPARIVFQLEPHGVGTWERQRLSSYIQELAMVSFLPPSKVRDCYGVAPYGHASTGARFDRSAFHTVNGAAECAKNWVAAFEPLVGRTDLADLTLLPFARFVGGAEGGFTHPRRRWCPRCLQDDAAAGRMPYERLLWVFKSVLACPMHEIYLEDTCPYCGLAQITEISRNCLPGHCGHCGGWFGKLEASQLGSGDTERFLYDVWCARDAANLLAMSARELETASFENVRNMLRYALYKKYPGIRPKLDSLSSSPWFVDDWLRGSSRPSMTLLGRLAWMFGVPMRSWISGQTIAWRDSCWRELPSGMTLRRHMKHGRMSMRYDLDAVATRLRESVAGAHPYLSAKAAAKAENISRVTLRRLFPEEYALVRDKGEALRAESAAENRSKKREIIRRLICELINEGVKPGYSTMMKKSKEFDIPYGIADGKLFAEIWSTWNDEALLVDRTTFGH